MAKVRKTAATAAFLLFLSASFTAPYQNFIKIPNRVRIPAGDVVRFARLPLAKTEPRAVTAGTVPRRAVWRLFGGPVIKTVTVEAEGPRRMVVLGGASIGIAIRPGGTTVLGFKRITTRAGSEVNPARAGGIRRGDRIISIGRVPVENDRVLAAAIDQLGSMGYPVKIKLRRGRQLITRVLHPTYDVASGRFRLGLYVKGDINGVGTLTFFDPDHRTWAALGHQVLGPTRQRAPGRGTIMPATVLGVARGRRGLPGEKIGLVEPSALGRVAANTGVGIVGRFGGVRPVGRLIEVASVDQVHPGPARMYTVLNGSRVESFSVLIERTFRQPHLASKGLIVRVTDPRLLTRTGGIVQGMSGSPLVQDGRLVGAVTHVFVNDPSRGFGVYALWMLKAADRLATSV